MAQHPGRGQQAPTTQDIYPKNPKLMMSNQGTVDEAAGRQQRIEGEFQQREAEKAQQVDQLAVAIATGEISEQELAQLPPELVQKAVQVAQSQQIQQPEIGQGAETPGLDFIEQGSYAQDAGVQGQQEQEMMGLAQAIQSGEVSEQQLQQLPPQLVQGAVSMLQQQANAPQADPFDKGPDIAGLAQAIQSGQIGEQELAQIDPEMVQAAVQMLQGQ